MSRKNGGIIGPANTPVGGLFKGVAGGVWRMNDVLNFVSNSQWPSTPKSIDNSLRFDKDSSDNLTRTPSSAGNQKTFTFSTWIKKGDFEGTEEGLLYSEPDSNTHTAIRIDGNDKLRVLCVRSGSTGNGFDKKTSRMLRDPSAWYHIVVAFDTTQSTADDRIKIYVNGVQETAFDTNTFGGSQSLDTDINSTTQQEIGMEDSISYFGGYMAETIMIDGLQLTPSSFGETDSTTGIWKPKKIGSFSSAGTNSFYLDFKDSSNVGKDASGLSNNFTVNNLTSIDQSTDTCVENFATLNPLVNKANYSTHSDGNLTIVGNDASNASRNHSTMAPSQGKWYMEFKAIDIQGTSYPSVGIISSSDASSGSDQVGGATNSVGYRPGGTILIDGSVTDTESTFTDNDIIGIAMDLDNGAVYFHKNGTYQNSGDPTSGSSRTGSLYNFTVSDSYHFSATMYTADAEVSANFGSPPYSISSGNSDANGFGNFEYSVPSGYYALNTSNLNTYG